MFDKFELPKPLDEFKMPPSKGINRKSHIGMLVLFLNSEGEIRLAKQRRRQSCASDHSILRKLHNSKVIVPLDLRTLNVD